MKSTLFLYFLLMLFASSCLMAQETPDGTVAKINSDFTAEISTDFSSFLNKGMYKGQQQYYGSLALKPELALDWNKGNDRMVMTLFGRLNTGDDNRTHWDVRELYYQKFIGNWELNLGLKEIYWGVTESVHLVNVINQTDLVESFDGEKKLGQPMAQITLLSNYGNFDFFAMPYHRKRTFPGYKGRLRFQLPVETRGVRYESGAGSSRIDLAGRWSHSISVFDIGLSHFWGNNREPLLTIDNQGKLRQYYEVVHQTGVDLQATAGSWLLKFEGTRRETDTETFLAIATGFEYTFGNINGNGLDIGILGEYLYDERGSRTTTGFQNDIFVGSRFALNDTDDTSILFGGIFDLDNSGKLFSVEADRRFFNDWKANLEIRILGDPGDPQDFLHALKEDSFVRMTVGYFFN